MIRNPLALIVLALAMVLAPFGVCLGRGHDQTATAMAATDHSAGLHGSDRHARHEGSAKHQFCTDCQPPDFIGTGKASGNIGPAFVAVPAVVPALVPIPAVNKIPPTHRFYCHSPPIPPPLPTATKVRLQI